MRVRIAMAVVALLMLCSCAPQVQSKSTHVDRLVIPATVVRVETQGSDPVFRLSDIDIDRLSTYPPMPAGTFVSVDPIAHRQHYTLEATVTEVARVGKSGTVYRTPVGTVILFDDGTGLVIAGTAYPLVRSGDVAISYSVPPSWVQGRPTDVLVHSMRSQN